MAMAVTYGNFGGQLVHESRGGAQSDYVGDSLGSVAALLDDAENATYEAQYWPHGESAEETGVNDTPWQYLGKFGYYGFSGASQSYVRNRNLSRKTAQWVSRDLFWPQELAYMYASLRPIDTSDPSGLQTGSILPPSGAPSNRPPWVFPLQISPPSQCSVKVCSQYGFGGPPGLVTHRYICSLSALGALCTGGLGPAKGKPGVGEVWGRRKPCQTGKQRNADGSTYNVVCEEISTSCYLAGGVCLCLGLATDWARQGKMDYSFPLKTCLTFADQIRHCACLDVDTIVPTDTQARYDCWSKVDPH
jgi:hypothetical protein